MIAVGARITAPSRARPASSGSGVGVGGGSSPASGGTRDAEQPAATTPMARTMSERGRSRGERMSINRSSTDHQLIMGLGARADLGDERGVVDVEAVRVGALKLED